MMMKTLLITGFDPFGGETVNPSWEAVSLLPDSIGSVRLIKLLLPVVFREAAVKVLAAAEEYHADHILCIGQAGGRKAVTPEFAALNVRAARIPDNSGNQPLADRIAENGPDGLFATVPVAQMAEAIRAAGLPGEVSYHAGTFVCNDVLYSVLHHFQETSVTAGFIHVPFIPEQAGEDKPSLPLQDIVRALHAAISCL